MKSRNTVIAIDGPAGSGKSTIARLLAEELNIEYIDSGAIYRTLTLFGMREFKGDCQGQEDRIAEYFAEHPEQIIITYQDHTQTMWLGNEDVSKKIRAPEVTGQVRYIADNPRCRSIVNDRIRKTAEAYSVVIDGRDIGTIVFPDTPFKFYLDARPETRAERRAGDLNIPLKSAEFEKLLETINQRDRQDRQREIAPLRKAPDAYFLDTTELSVGEVLDVILERIQSIPVP